MHQGYAHGGVGRHVGMSRGSAKSCIKDGLKGVKVAAGHLVESCCTAGPAWSVDACCRVTCGLPGGPCILKTHIECVADVC